MRATQKKHTIKLDQNTKKVASWYYLSIVLILVVWLVYFGFTFRNSSRHDLLENDAATIDSAITELNAFAQKITGHFVVDLELSREDFIFDLQSLQQRFNSFPEKSVIGIDFPFRKIAGIFDQAEKDYLTISGSKAIQDWSFELVYQLGVNASKLIKHREQIHAEREILREQLGFAFFSSWVLVFALFIVVVVAIWRDFKYKEAIQVIL